MRSSGRFAILALSATVLSACKGGGETAAPADASASASATVAAASQSAGAAPGQQACAPVKLELSPARFAEGRASFAEGKPGRTRLAAAFAKAYDEACAAGWLAKKPLIDPRAASKDTLFVANAPNANVAAIYFDENAGAREMVIEGPFVDAGGHVQVPGAAAVKEAIYCYAVGATDKEQEETGRCLVD